MTRDGEEAAGGQRSRVSTDRFNRLINRWIPVARAVHPYPMTLRRSAIRGGSRMRRSARTDLCGRRPAIIVPTATVRLSKYELAALFCGEYRPVQTHSTALPSEPWTFSQVVRLRSASSGIGTPPRSHLLRAPSVRASFASSSPTKPPNVSCSRSSDSASMPNSLLMRFSRSTSTNDSHVFIVSRLSDGFSEGHFADCRYRVQWGCYGARAPRARDGSIAQKDR